MKKILLLLLIMGTVAGFLFIQQDEKAKKSAPENHDIEPVDSIKTTSLFVPDWTLNHTNNWQEYQNLIYFGVPLTENGLEFNNSQITSFTQSAPANAKTLLTITMLDHATNQLVLDDKSLQQRSIDDAIQLAKSHSFDGIVIDFESKSISFSTVTDRNTEFLVESLNLIKAKGLEAYATLYGDNYFRARAYDVARIAGASDGILIMAYDFHKSGGGTPGPNFPITGTDLYGYDFEQMLADFTQDADPDKITVVFGMFGYDWSEKEKMVETGAPVTLNQIENKFLTSCQLENCSAEIDNLTLEHKITYSENGLRHTVWAESEKSIEKKIEIAKKMGISKTGFWANSFF